MDLNKENIKKLQNMRLLGDNDDIDIFDEIVYKVSMEANIDSIKDLTLVLDDESSTPSAMENVIQCIFTIANRCGLENGLYEILSNSRVIVKQAKGWFIEINKMILNYEPFYNSYIDALKSIDDEDFVVVMDTLDYVKNISSKYERIIDDIVNKL
ncbi:Imm30 family immunity protein (plasmid) [Clostridium perfringens]